MVNQKIQLEKFPGKGGWTYARLPEIPKDPSRPFGLMKVKGLIDAYEIQGTHLMPIGNGRLFLAVKAAIRKAIKNEAGDWVHIVLLPDKDPLPVPGEFLECLEYEPQALKLFGQFSEADQKAYLNWIYSSRKEETRIERIAAAITKIARGLRFGE